MYHGESDSLFEVDASEFDKWAREDPINFELCNDVTGSPQWEAEFEKRRMFG